MSFTDVFVRRPVLASVVSLLILVLGLRAITALEVREYPETENTVVTVTTAYPGASAELVESFITTPLQRAIAEAEGIDYLTARSQRGRSVIEAHMELDYDANAAVSEIQAKVASQRRLLPEAAEDPVIDATTGQQTALMYLAFFSPRMTPPQIADYLSRAVQPRLQSVPGVARAEILGNRSFAMRVWLDPQRMAALGVTEGDVRAALERNNVLAGAGQAKGAYVAIDLDVTTDAATVEDFRDLVIRRSEDRLVRLEDVARPSLGAETYNSTSWYRDKTAVYIAVEPTPGANPLTVAQRVRDRLPDIRGQLPEGLSVAVPYDASVFIEDSIEEVFRTLGEAVLIVLAVVLLALGSARAAIVPGVAVPLSLVGGAFLMLMMGFSVNLLTLLALVLAIGLVVDDAIVVVENVHRHVEQGKSRRQAALDGARELGLPIVAMTTTLVAVYAPIGFMGGLIGTLFTEFAFALAGAVVISGVVALTLSPMLSGAVLRSGSPGRMERAVNGFFDRLAVGYKRSLHSTLDTVWVVVVFAAVVLVSNYFLFTTAKSELAPTEDQGILFFSGTAPQTATIEYDEAYAARMVEQFETIPEYDEAFLLLGQGGDPSQVFGGFKMTPAAVRAEKGQRSQFAVMPELQRKMHDIAGLDIAVFPRPSLPGSGGGFPIQFVITGPSDHAALIEAADRLIANARGSGRFAFLNKSVELSRPLVTVHVDRDRAGALGIDMAEVGGTLATMLGGNDVNRFSLEGRSYRVIPQAAREHRLTPDRLADYYVRAGGGELVPLSALISLERSVEPSQRTRFQQLNAVTVQGVPAPGTSMGEALGYLEERAAALLPTEMGHDYAGLSRQFATQGSALVLTFFLALLVIYLVLAAQFESWRDPLIILVSVPLSIAGALAFITLGFASLNIYTQVGLITLIGLIAKNGILIVEFANRLQARDGLDRRTAVEEAAAIRLRPVLMTTAAMVMAMVPLLLASGPGAVSRFQIGLVIAGGLGIGTLFTLYVVPAVYLVLARRHGEEAEGEESRGAGEGRTG